MRSFRFASLMFALSTAFVRSWAPNPSRSRVSRRLFQGRSFFVSNTNSNLQHPGDNSSQDGVLEWTTAKVRSTFVEFFQQEPRAHSFQPSSPSVPLNDPTLLFTNAGMNQFKPIFLGQVNPNSPMAQLKRACNSQKCIRAGGKHNDLEDVGRDTYHHTFFEMLGTWSFGDYFKKEAIDYAWELLTQVYGLEPDRLYATYFQGDENVEADFDARDLWLQYLPEDHVIGCSARDNFWEMGDVGPCGPCSEIHYDRIGRRNAAAMVNADDPNVIEIWNIVFIQYNREPDRLQPLPAKHIDTGMGLERLVSILQRKSSNYDIDCFQPLFQKIAEHSSKGPYTGRVGPDDVDLKDTAYRAIADHARTLSFAIADGAVPNNEGRGYVLRRILRRATRYGQQILGAPPGFFSTLVPVVVDTFGVAYPELIKAKDNIIEIIQDEEQSFSTMLERGIKFFSELESELKDSGEKQISGEKAFYLYDTLGFPIDLTELMAQEAGMVVDTEGFGKEMEAQKKRSRDSQRASRSGGEERLEFVAEQTAWLNDHGVLPTDDGFKYKWDVDLPATVMAIYTSGGFLTGDQIIEAGQYAGIVLDKSSFYAEGGGQVSDVGFIDILAEDGTVVGSFSVSDVQVYGGFILHTGTIEEGQLEVGSHVSCHVNYDRRRLIAPNHSMTHILNAALRSVLGEGVDQRGSLCNEEKLRFDFNHKKAMTTEELRAVEQYCQNCVREGLAVTSQLLPLDEAKAINGVRAMFGEVYPDPVRVVTMGDEASVEFCGGTHVANTAEAEAFVIVEETAVAKGIRRISAVTKNAAADALKEGKRFLSAVQGIEEMPTESDGLEKLAGSIRKDLDAAFVSASLKAELRARIEAVQKKASDFSKRGLQQRVDQCLNEVREVVAKAASNNEPILVLNVDIGADAKASQRVISTVRDLAPGMAFFGLSEESPGSGGKVMAFAVVPDVLTDTLKADEWVQVALESCGGRGGGKANNAQGQARDCDNIEVVLENARKFGRSKIEATVS